MVGYVPARPDSPDAGSSAGARARRRFARAINIVYALGSLASATGRRTPSRGGSETPPSRPTSVENLRRPGPPTPSARNPCCRACRDLAAAPAQPTRICRRVIAGAWRLEQGGHRPPGPSPGSRLGRHRPPKMSAGAAAPGRGDPDCDSAARDRPGARC